MRRGRASIPEVPREERTCPWMTTSATLKGSRLVAALQEVQSRWLRDVMTGTGGSWS